MPSTGGINGGALFVAALGGVLVYAGFSGVSPVAALRSIASGHPLPPPTTPVDLTNDTVNVSGGVMWAPPGTFGPQGASGSRAAVVAAAGKYMGDRYSQLHRREPGFSDCSSFVDKCLKDAGIAPPSDPWANTTLYLMSPLWRTIPQSQAQPGDIAVSVGHMVLITAAGGAQAIGQENERINVRTGAPAQLFSSTEHYVFKTYTGYRDPVPGARAAP